MTPQLCNVNRPILLIIINLIRFLVKLYICFVTTFTFNYCLNFVFPFLVLSKEKVTHIENKNSFQELLNTWLM